MQSDVNIFPATLVLMHIPNFKVVPKLKMKQSLLLLFLVVNVVAG